MKKFIYNLINKIRGFLYGRNGFDDLAKHTMIASIIVFLIYGFWPQGLVKFIFIKTYPLNFIITNCDANASISDIS